MSEMIRRFSFPMKGNDCPDCGSLLIVISLPSETPTKRECVYCGLITWFLPEVHDHTGKPMHRITAKIFWNHMGDI